MLSLVVYKLGGEYYAATLLGKAPSIVPPAKSIFTVTETDVSSPQAARENLFRRAREEANRLNLGKVVNLPD